MKKRTFVVLIVCVLIGMAITFFYLLQVRHIQTRAEMEQFTYKTYERFIQASAEERGHLTKTLRTEVERRCNIEKTVPFSDGVCIIALYDKGKRCFWGIDNEGYLITVVFEEDIPTYQEMCFFQKKETTLEEAETFWGTNFFAIFGSFRYTTIHMVREGMISMSFSTDILQEWNFRPKDSLDGYWTEFYATVYAQMAP